MFIFVYQQWGVNYFLQSSNVQRKGRHCGWRVSRLFYWVGATSGRSLRLAALLSRRTAREPSHGPRTWGVTSIFHVCLLYCTSTVCGACGSINFAEFPFRWVETFCCCFAAGTDLLLEATISRAKICRDCSWSLISPSCPRHRSRSVSVETFLQDKRAGQQHFISHRKKINFAAFDFKQKSILDWKVS